MLQALVSECGSVEVWTYGSNNISTSVPPHFHTITHALGAIRTLTNMGLSHAPLPVGVQGRKPMWRVGVMECRHYSITPTLHYSRSLLALGVEGRLVPNGDEVGRFAEAGSQERVQDAFALQQLMHRQFDLGQPPFQRDRRPQDRLRHA